MQEKIIAFIPARYDAIRFPAKLMQKLGNQTVILQTYNRTLATELFTEVVVVTDSTIIYDEIKKNGGKAIMSKKKHDSGSDRIAEAVADYNVDIVVNVQGDEPFVKKEPLQKLLEVFSQENSNVQVASLMQKMTDEKYIQDPNYVKVVVNKQHQALLFSRLAIPYRRDYNIPITYYEHIGIYAFRKNALLQFTQWSPTYLEQIEKIECLRYLENGIPIQMVTTSFMGIEIDTPDDLERANQYLTIID